MTIMRVKLLAGVLALAVASSASAITVNVATSAGTSFNTTGIASFTTGVNDMNGMQITAFFADGSSSAAALSGSSAVGVGWTVSFTGSTTFSEPWTVSVANTSTSLITSMLFSGASGDTVFDTGLGSNTPGSAGGRTIEAGNTSYTGSSLSTLNVTYQNRVSLNGTFYGDLFESMNLGFVQGLASDDQLTFITDTDNSAIKGDIKRVSDSGASIMLLGFALAVLGFFRRNK